MINQQAIAQHLKIEVSQIKSVGEWASVLFVVVKGKGARFVSKKVGIVTNPYILEAQALVDEYLALGGEMWKSQITKNKAATWAAEIIRKHNCGMNDGLIELIFNSISEGHKPGYIKTFKNLVQDRLNELASWDAENAKYAAIEAPEEEVDEYQEWLKDQEAREISCQY